MKDTAVLLIDCPDRKGLVARVSSLLYHHGSNILHADQHQDHDLGLFFMRVEFALAAPAWALEALAPGVPLSTNPNPPNTLGAPGLDSETGDRAISNNPARFDLEAFRAAFKPLAAELGMNWQLTTSAAPTRVALFCSQYLHCMADLLHRCHSGELPCHIALIVSNHRHVEPLAGFYGIPFEHVPVTAETRPAAEARHLQLLAAHQVELVVLARYMQILSPPFVARYPARIINVHHSFLPAFTGARPYHAAHARGVKLIGATSHYVTEVLDDGPIIEQDVARISHRDQVEDLVARGRDLERIVLSRAVRWHLDRRILCYGNKTVVFD